MLLLANEFNVRSVLHKQVSLAAVNQFYVFHEAMNAIEWLQKSKDLLKACFEHVNVMSCIKINKRASGPESHTFVLLI